MTPVDGGRYCASYRKTVMDFAEWTDDALAAFFSKPENTRICGRFRDAQLNRPMPLPHQPHSALYHWVIAVGVAAITLTAVSASAQAGHPVTPLPIVRMSVPPADTISAVPGSGRKIEQLPFRVPQPVPVLLAGPHPYREQPLNIGAVSAEITTLVISEEAIQSLLPQPATPPEQPEPQGTRRHSGAELDRMHGRQLEDALEGR